MYLDFFFCDIGVRQGENLSPFLFGIFLSDLEKYFVHNNVNGLQDINDKCKYMLRTYIIIFVLFYADDTAILAETPDDRQNCLRVFEHL